MFELDPRGSYMMPAHFGPRPLGPRPSGWYHDVTSMSVAFLTDAATLSRYLPPHFRVAEEPVVTITYACNRSKYIARYLLDGKIEIDNNLVENQIRPIALGRKNYLFA